MEKASTLVRPRNWKSVFLVLFVWCLVGSINAQTTLDLSNDTRANDTDCDLVDIQGPTCPETTIEYLFCENAPDAEAPAFTDCSEIAETSYNDLVFGFCGRFTSAERDTLVARSMANTIRIRWK